MVERIFSGRRSSLRFNSAPKASRIYQLADFVRSTARAEYVCQTALNSPALIDSEPNEIGKPKPTG